MKTSGNTILITGGGTGIGLALAVRFLQQGNEVIICGRRLEKLNEAQRQYPQLHIYQCDLSQESARRDLFKKVTRDFPKLNVLMNNAGVSLPTRLDRPESWPQAQQQLQTNLAATIHLTQLFAQHLSRQSAPVVFVTTSGLAYIPRAAAPVYCATKAALHSYALTLRHQLKSQEIEVIEICPPHVDTDLSGPGISRRLASRWIPSRDASHGRGRAREPSRSPSRVLHEGRQRFAAGKGRTLFKNHLNAA